MLLSWKGVLMLSLSLLNSMGASTSSSIYTHIQVSTTRPLGLLRKPVSGVHQLLLFLAAAETSSLLCSAGTGWSLGCC